MFRLIKKLDQHEMWGDIPNFVVQSLAHRVCYNDLCDDFDGDKEGIYFTMALINSACIELKSRNLKSFNLFGE